MQKINCRLQFGQIITVVFFFLTTVHLGFAEKWPPISPDDLKMTSIAEQLGAPAVILIRQEIDDDNKNEWSFYTRIKVLTEAGRKYADTELPYDRRQFSVTQISGRTIHPDGTIVKFEGKPFDKLVHKAHGITEHVKVISLPDVQVGSIIDLRYTLSYSDRVLWAPDWDVQSDLFQKQVNFKFYPYMDEWSDKQTGRSGRGIAWSPELPKQYQLQQHTPSVVDTNPDKTAIELNIADVPAIVDEPYTPPLNTFGWRVNFYYTTSSTREEYWRNEGKYWTKDVEAFVNRKNGIDAALPQIIAASDTPEQKVKKIYSFVSKLENQSFIPDRPQQQIQAMGLHPNRGAEDVLQQRSGTNDELNRLFIAMVRSAGIPAWLMLVPDRGLNFFEPYRLSMHQFDAEIAIVEIGGNDVFLDPGTQFCPYGLLPWHYSSVQGVREIANGTEIGKTTPPEYQRHAIRRTAVLQLADDGTEQGTVAVSFIGLEAMKRRQQAAQTDAVGRKKQLEDEIKSWLPNGSDVNMTNDPMWNDAEVPLTAEFKISGPLAVSAGKRRLIPLHIFEVNDAPMFPASARANGIYFDNPYSIVDETHITLPAGTSIESLPPDIAQRLDYALYESKQRLDQATTVSAIRNIIMGGMAFPADKYQELKGFYDKVSMDDQQQVLLKAAAHAEGNGN